MITGVSLGQMEENQAPVVVSNSNEYKQIRKENYALQKQLDAVEAKLNQEKELKNELENTNKLYEKKLKEYDEISQKSVDWQKRIIESNNEIDSRESAIQKLEGEVKVLQENISSAEKEIAFRLDPANHPVNKVTNIKDGRIKIPYFMECKKDTLSYIENGSVKKQFKPPLASNKEFHQFLEKAGLVNTGGIIFLVRDDGTEIYEEAKKLAIHFSVLSGKLPVRGIGLLDTSAFKTSLPATPGKKIQVDQKILDMLKKKKTAIPQQKAKEASAEKTSAPKADRPDLKKTGADEGEAKVPDEKK